MDRMKAAKNAKTIWRNAVNKTLESGFLMTIKTRRLAQPIPEFLFYPDRKWRFDFAWPDLKVAVEVQGGTRLAKGGHNTHDGIRRSCEKLNAAARLGWRVFQFTNDMVNDHSAGEFMESIIPRETK